MRESETAKVIAVLKVLDPYPPKGDTTEERQAEARTFLRVWHAAIGYLPYEATVRAAQRWTATERRFPAPIDIRELVAEETFDLLDSAIAWNQVAALIHSPIRRPCRDVHPVVMNAVRQCGGFQAMRMSERPELTRKAFEEAYARERKREVLRPDLGVEAERRAELASGNRAAITGESGQ